MSGHIRQVGAWLALCFMALPGSPSLARGADHVAVEEALAAWDVTEAGTLLDRIIADEAAEGGEVAPHTLFLTGHLHLMRGRYSEAVEYLNQAVHAGASPLAAHYLQLAIATEQQTSAYEHHATADGHFIISHSPGVDALLVPYTEAALGRAWTELTRIFDFVPDHPIRVELYPTVDVLGAVSPLTVQEIRTSGTIALCKYNRLMVTSPRDLVYGYDWLDTLSHEFIHLLITKKSRNNVPIWLHEGLAKYYELMWKGPDARPALDRRSQSLLAKALEDDALISFAEMSPSMAKLPSQVATATAFAEVFTVISFLKERAGSDVAAALVAKMGEGQSDRDAVAAVAKLPWDRFEAVWTRFLKRQGFKAEDRQHELGMMFKGADTEMDELATVKVQSARDLVWLGDKLRAKKRWKAAAKQYRKATTHVGEMSPLIQGKLGYALLRLGALSDAATALQKPIERYPRHVILHVYLGEALLKMGRFEEARESLERAVNINPFDPDVHASLAIAYERLGRDDLAKTEREAHALIHGQ